MSCISAAQLKFSFQTDLGSENSASYYRQGRQLLLTLHSMITRWSRSLANFNALIGQNLTGEFMRKIYAASWILFSLTVDFSKVLRFSFPLPVVGPSAKDFYPLWRAKSTGGIFLLWVLSNHERFYWCAVNQTRSRHMKRDLNCFDPNSI